MLRSKTTAVFSEICTQLKSTLCGQRAEFFLTLEQVFCVVTAVIWMVTSVYSQYKWREDV
jgi:hypothetical protein